VPTPTAGTLVSSGTRVITHAVGASTSISIGSGSYGRGAIVVVAIAGESGAPAPNTTHRLEVLADGGTYTGGGDSGSSGGVIAHLIVEAAAEFGPSPDSFDAGFTIRFRSPSSTFDGVLGYAFFTSPISAPRQLYVQNINAIVNPAPFSSDGGTIELQQGLFTAFHTDNLFTYGSKAGYALHAAGGPFLFGTTAADWTGRSGWVNAARIFSTTGSVSIGFYNQPGLYSVDWSISNPPSGETNESFVDILSDALIGARLPSRSFAQVIG
jgi:hypothetical protein